jgi:hypothetical protein
MATKCEMCKRPAIDGDRFCQRCEYTRSSQSGHIRRRRSLKPEESLGQFGFSIEDELDMMFDTLSDELDQRWQAHTAALAAEIRAANEAALYRGVERNGLYNRPLLTTMSRAETAVGGQCVWRKCSGSMRDNF